MEINRISSYLYCFILVSIISCTNNSSDNISSDDISNNNLIILTPQQLSQIRISTTYIKNEKIEDIINCEGKIIANPNQQAYASVPMNGFLKKILVNVGEFVKKGQPLAILEHPNYIDLQREFLETKSQFNYYKEDFRRQGELSLENATSLKKMQFAEKEYRKLEVRYFALKEHLEFIGINPDSLFVDRIKSSILLKAPISGNVTESQVKIGQLCTTKIPVFQIISATNALLNLQVSESAAWKIEKGQSLEFNPTNNQNETYRAVIRSFTKSVDESNAINIHAKIIDMDEKLFPGLNVKAKIVVNEDSVLALNNMAIVKRNDSHYIFLKTDSTGFIPHKIEIGRTNNDFSEIVSIDSYILDAEIVTSGADYLQSLLSEEK